jgi:lysophospholipase L1-like esterase
MRNVIYSLFIVLSWAVSPNLAQDKSPPAIDPKFAVPATDAGQPGAGPIRRYDRFLVTWATRRAEFAANNEAEQGSLVLFGDSITQGWGKRPAELFPGLKIANRGISGDTTRGMLLRLQQDVLSLNPKGIVMLMGTNDLEEQAEPSVIAGNVKLIFDAVKKHDPNLPIVFCSVFPSSESKKRSVEKIKALNEAYATICRGNPQVTVVDTWTLYADADGNAKAEEFPDLLHLNDAGYRKWAAALRPVLATLGFLETEPDSFQLESGYRSLFNGTDLTGWGFRKTSGDMLATAVKMKKRDPSKSPAWPIIAEDIPFNGKSTSSDGRYVAKNGRLIVTTPTEGRRIQQLWTIEEFSGDFVLKLEFRATPNADSGVFIRQPQLQCRDFPLAGPYKDLKNYKPQDWNELVVEVTGPAARCTCNGELLEAEFKVPPSGPIGLEGDRGQLEYRRIRIKEGKL